jgi:hypothetical protein
MAAAQSWFVYYKVPNGACNETSRRARSVAAALASRMSIAPRLMRKADDAATATLMEIYEGIDDPDRFAAAMADAVVASGMPQELIDARRVERFVPVE